jgi:ribosomal-protein-alanine N-acetyltransferase
VNTAADSPIDHLFGIFLASQERHVGNIKVGPVNIQHSRADISLFIGEKELWGCGLASDAIRCATWFGFKVLGLRKLEAGCYEENMASCKAFQGCGFEIEGTLRDHLLHDGKPSARTCLGLTHEDWKRQSWCNEPKLLKGAAR